jgi:hypothetical protein
VKSGEKWLTHCVFSPFLGSSRMRSKKRKELVTIVAPKAILQKNVIRKNKIGRTNSKVQFLTL